MEEKQRRNVVDRILAPILDQLATLKQPVGRMTFERLPTPPDVK